MHCSAVPVTVPGATGAAGLTVMEISLLSAVSGLAHVAFEVSTTVTLSAFTSEVVVKVLLLVPVFIPLIFHW